MASVNKAILLGNIGRDPELRYTPSGNAVCTATLATSRQWKDKTSGERHEETEWHRVVFYDRLAEIAGEYLKKGSAVYVEGRLKTRKWTDKDGNEKYTTEIVADQMQLLGGRGGSSRGDEGGAEGHAAGNGGAEARGEVAGGAPRGRSPAGAGTGGRSSAGGRAAAQAHEPEEDDIPFGFPASADVETSRLERRMGRYR